jgi:hypothetical protein
MAKRLKEGKEVKREKEGRFYTYYSIAFNYFEEFECMNLINSISGPLDIAR